MARDLFSSKKNKASRPKKASISPKINEEALKDISESDMAQAKSVIDSMSGKSEQEMQAELFKTVDQQMASGNLDMNALDNFAKQAAGMLSPDQVKKLNQLTGAIKRRANNSLGTTD